ncbi:MAG: hypothetical protein P1V97_37355 [Planctomycetota bacterium]|nr:hypothetical protein [Planctomycetota bacterium]
MSAEAGSSKSEADDKKGSDKTLPEALSEKPSIDTDTPTSSDSQASEKPEAQASENSHADSKDSEIETGTARTPDSESSDPESSDPESSDPESSQGLESAAEADESQSLNESLNKTKVAPKASSPKLSINLAESKKEHPEDVLDTKSLADIHKEKGFEQDLLETKSLNQIRSCRGTKAGSERIQRAYGLVNNLLRDRLETEDDENLALLDGLKASDVLVVNGDYDHIHLVLENLNIPFLTTFPNALPVQELRPDQTVFVNCGRDFPLESAFVLEKFVRNGGQMISTDWALKTVLQVAFPRYVKYNRRATKDEVVGIQVLDKDDPVLAGFIDEEENPVWWLEDASYPIRILDKTKVEVLIRSEELGKRYGEDAVLVKFHHGEGVVYHMISHFYLQRAETRSAKQKSKASSYAKSKGASEATLAQFKKVEEASADMDYGLTQTAMTSAEFVSRSILSQRKRFLDKSKKTGARTPKKDI